MCEDILKNIITQKITVENLTEWLCQSKPIPNVQWECTEGEFIIFFLNYLRDQTKSILDIPEHGQVKITTPRRNSLSSLKSEPINDSTIDKPRSYAETSANLLVASTPDTSKRSLETSKIETSVLSPIASSSFNNSMQNTSNAKRNIYKSDFYNGTSPNNRSRASNTTLGDFIDFNMLKSNEKPRRIEPRRIRPTPIQPKPASVQMKAIFEEKTPLTSPQFERIAIKQDCLRMKNDQFTIKNVPVPNDAVDTSVNLITNWVRSCMKNEQLPMKNVAVPSDVIEPSVDSVTNAPILDCLAQMYAVLLANNLVLNALNELYFLLSLLFSPRNRQPIDLSRSVGNIDFDIDTIYIDSIHNGVYFAVKVLTIHPNILNILETTTLKILSENARVKTFSHVLFARIVSIYTSRALTLVAKTLRATTVFYQPDSDSRSNFRDDKSFATFRKQRDLFYDILQTWHGHRFNVMWKFKKLRVKIQTLFHLSSDPINLMHLSRLFKSQLLNNCRNSTGVENDDLPLVNVDSTKLSLLQDRLTTKNSGENFADYEEFYRDFLLNVETHAFFRHVIDSFTTEIRELVDTSMDLIISEQEIDERTRSEFLTNLIMLKTTAKFLAFVECLPYDMTHAQRMSDEIKTNQLRVRAHTEPAVNVHAYLRLAMRNRCLVLMVPWICEYITALDYITIRLSRHERVLFQLFRLYMCAHSCVVVRIAIGLMMDSANFPGEKFYEWLSRRINDDSLGVDTIDNTSDDDNVEKIELDSLQLIDEKQLTMLFPYLNEIKKIVATSRVTRPVVTKHIRPVTTLTLNSKSKDKEIQLQLEEAFFNSYPLSTRKTVDFVAERVASTCVKYVCNTFVPQLKQRARDQLHASQLESPEAMAKLVQSTADFCMHELIRNYFPEEMCKKRCEGSLSSLMPVETPLAVLHACVLYAIRQVKHKVAQWIQSHTSKDVFTRDLENFLKKRDVKQVQATVICAGGEFDLSDKCPLNIIVKLRDYQREFFDTYTTSITATELQSSLRDIDSSIQTRCDWTTQLYRQTLIMTIDLTVMLISCQPSIVDEVTTQLMLNIWTRIRDKIGDDPMVRRVLIQTHMNDTLDCTLNDSKVSIHLKWDASINREDVDSCRQLQQSTHENIFLRMLCKKNVAYIKVSAHTSSAWSQLAVFLHAMLTRDIVSRDELGEMCAGFFHTCWDTRTIREFCTCLRHLRVCVDGELQLLIGSLIDTGSLIGDDFN